MLKVDNMASVTRTWWEGGLYREDRVTSVTTSGYHNLVAQGMALPDNPYSHYGTWKQSAYMTTGIWVYLGQRWQFQRETMRFEAPPGIGLPVFNWAEPNNMFLAKVKTQSVSVITMFAERKKTAHLLETFVGNILYTLVHWKKPRAVLKRWLGTDKKVRKWATRKLDRSIARCTSASEAWLQYRFAVRPLMYDIKSALDAFEKGDKKQHLVHVSRKDKWFDTAVQKGLGPYGNIDGKAQITYEWKIVGRFVVSDPSLAALGNLASVSASIWDLIPLSFVVDWAWDISRWLDLQNATLGLTFKSGYTGLKTTTTRTYYPVHRYTPNYRYIPHSDFPATWTSLNYSRKVMVSCPKPSIQTGTLGSIFGDGHLVDMLAIIRQLMVGKQKATYYFTPPQISDQ